MTGHEAAKKGSRDQHQQSSKKTRHNHSYGYGPKDRWEHQLQLLPRRVVTSELVNACVRTMELAPDVIPAASDSLGLATSAGQSIALNKHV
jgi:hypothetical protein